MHVAYEAFALQEMQQWQQQMQQSPTFLNNLAKKLQVKVNSYIPDKVHRAITTTIKQMVRAMLFGAEKLNRKPLVHAPLAERENLAQQRIEFYKKAAATEGGITGAGGILLGLADFPLLLSLKLKLLYDIAAFYGFAVDDYRERIYMLHIFQLAFSSHQHRREVYLQMRNWELQKNLLPEDINQFDWQSFQQEYRDYIDLAKMAQLIPIIGAPVGAIVNYNLLNKLGRTAINAYRMRWFENRKLLN